MFALYHASPNAFISKDCHESHILLPFAKYFTPELEFKNG